MRSAFPLPDGKGTLVLLKGIEAAAPEGGGQLSAGTLTAPRCPCTKAPLFLTPGARLALGESDAADGLSATRSAQEPPNLRSRSPAATSRQSCSSGINVCADEKGPVRRLGWLRPALVWSILPGLTPHSDWV